MKAKYGYVGQVIASTNIHTSDSLVPSNTIDMVWSLKVAAASKFVDFLSKVRLPRELRKQLQCMIVEDAYPMTEEWEAILSIMGTVEPPLCFFGAIHNGHDYGFYLCSDWEEELIDSGGKVIDSLPLRAPADWRGCCVAVINDHGNASLYRVGRNGRFYLLWEVV